MPGGRQTFAEWEDVAYLEAIVSGCGRPRRRSAGSGHGSPTVGPAAEVDPGHRMAAKGLLPAASANGVEAEPRPASRHWT